MMQNSESPATPVSVSNLYEAYAKPHGSWEKASLGLTKREIMAMHIMCGMQANADINLSSERMAEEAIKAADALLLALENT